MLFIPQHDLTFYNVLSTKLVNILWMYGICFKLHDYLLNIFTHFLITNYDTYNKESANREKNRLYDIETGPEYCSLMLCQLGERLLYFPFWVKIDIKTKSINQSQYIYTVSAFSWVFVAGDTIIWGTYTLSQIHHIWLAIDMIGMKHACPTCAPLSVWHFACTYLHHPPHWTDVENFGFPILFFWKRRTSLTPRVTRQLLFEVEGFLSSSYNIGIFIWVRLHLYIPTNHGQSLATPMLVLSLASVSLI